MPELINNLAKSIGFPADQLSCILLLLLSYPFSILYTTLIPASKPWIKHTFSILVTVTLWTYFFDLIGLLHLFGLSLVCYGVMKFWGKTLYGPIVVFLIALTHLNVNRLLKQLASFGDMTFDHTAPQMVLVIKLSSVAWSYYDGCKSEAEREKMAPDQKRASLEDGNLPGLLEFGGFLFFMPSFIAGPAFHFRDYLEFTNGKVTPTLRKDGYCSRVIWY
jgi:lysophospholipid acyltransferase